MAILGSIQKRTGLLLFVVAAALFIFIVQAALENGFFGSNANNVGSINGTDIDAQAFMRKVAQMEKQGQGQNMSNTQAMNSAWDQEVRAILLGDEAEKLGITLGDEQLINEIKKNPYFAQNPQFQNEAGAFDEYKFKEFVKSIKNDPNPERWAEWQNFEKEVEKSAIQQMYFNMIKGGVFTTTAEGKFKYTAENKKVDFEYVTVPYTTVNNDEVKVSDDEIIAYMKKYPKKYKSDATRSIEYVLFENKPSATDEKAMENAMNKVMYGEIVFNETTKTNDTLPAFKDVTNVSQYVNENSDIKFDSTYVTKKNLPLEFQEQLFNLSKGEVFGPYANNGYQNVSKMLDRKSNASAKAAHILISYAGAPQATVERTKEEAQALANELLAKAKANPANFGKLAAENSDDPGSKNNNGEYDNITPGQMVPTFNDFVFNNGVGTIGLVETDYGFHVIRVLDKYDSVLLATVAQKVEPSETTVDENYTKASKFEADANSKDFAEVAKKYEATVIPATNLKATDEYVGAIGAQREMVRWAFNDDSNVGDVRRFDIPKGFVVAKITSKNETGLLALDLARQSVGTTLKNEKKALKIREKMKGSSLEDVAKATGGSVNQAQNIAMGSAVIPNIGLEPKVVGKAFTLATGKSSDLIDGNSGVYMIRGKKVKEASAVNTYTSYVTQELQQQQNQAQMKAYNALKEKADIEDERGRM